MQKIRNFIINLKPYRRLYSIFLLSIWMIGFIFILNFLFLLQLFVPHNETSYFYFFRGFHALFSQVYKNEPNSSSGFIIAGVIIGYIPFIFCLPIMYLKISKWLMLEKISLKFQSIPLKIYLRWYRIIHFSILGLSFTIIPGIIMTISGFNMLPQHAWRALGSAFQDDFGLRSAGISAFLYYGVGFVFLITVVAWLIWLALVWIFKQIAKFFRYIGKLINESKERRKIAKEIKKSQNAKQ